MSLDFKNMPNERLSLIKLFALNSLDTIENNADLILNIFNGVGGITDCGKLQDITGYNSFYEKLYMVKRQLDRILESDDEATEVRHCLSAIKSYKEKYETQEEKNILIEMISQCQANNNLWTNNPELTVKYKKGLEMIDEWVDFFLSYTNRDQPDINTAYTPELERIFRRVEWDEKYEQMNFLAKLIIKYLKSFNSLNAFFDQESMVNGDDLNEQVYRYCAKTFAFAQLVEPMALAFQPGRINWCFDEYTCFTQNNPDQVRRKFFIKTHTMPGVIYPTYQQWYNDINVHRNYTITQPLNRNALQTECGVIAQQIVETRESVITNFIANV